ncbi:MAG: methylated-DNA--[protein]-cysteine S-methyltransferase [Acidimicrobiales bacterium]
MTTRIIMDSPVGALALHGDDDALHYIGLPGTLATRDDAIRVGTGATARLPEALGAAVDQLGEYFAGKRTSFDLPLVLEGTPFQCAVWRELGEIPYGKTISYAELAALVGRPTAFRAVGQANGRNPIPIVLPCHRVVASGGRIGGYGGGLSLKRRLLALEGVADVG